MLRERERKICAGFTLKLRKSNPSPRVRDRATRERFLERISQPLQISLIQVRANMGHRAITLMEFSVGASNVLGRSRRNQ